MTTFLSLYCLIPGKTTKNKVAFNEFAGDPPSIDAFAYSVRLFTGGKDKTSFGDLSMQVRTAMETLGYSSDPKKRELGVQNHVIESLMDNKQAFFIVAKHLSDLRDKDYKGVSASSLTDEQIQVVGTRYNRGIGLSIDQIKKNLSYGKAITKRKDKLQELIKEEKPNPPSSNNQNSE